jgi:hypothetical protein
MGDNDVVASRDAKHGKKMIEVRLRFWTDDISPTKGKIIPKHAWTSGVVRLQGNASQGIVSDNPKPFNSLLDVGAVIETVLLEAGIKLPSRHTRKYMASDKNMEG